MRKPPVIALVGAAAAILIAFFIPGITLRAYDALTHNAWLTEDYGDYTRQLTGTEMVNVTLGEHITINKQKSTEYAKELAYQFVRNTRTLLALEKTEPELSSAVLTILSYLGDSKSPAFYSVQAVDTDGWEYEFLLTTDLKILRVYMRNMLPMTNGESLAGCAYAAERMFDEYLAEFGLTDGERRLLSDGNPTEYQMKFSDTAGDAYMLYRIADDFIEMTPTKQLK